MSDETLVSRLLAGLVAPQPPVVEVRGTSLETIKGLTA